MSFGQALAQAPEPAGVREPNWDVIRKAALSQLDQQTVQKWLAATMDQILADSVPTTAGAAFLKRIADELSNQASAQAYKAGLAQVVVDGFVAKYQSLAGTAADKRPGLGVVYLLMAVREVTPALPANYPGLLTGYQAALADPVPAVRCHALMGLNQIRANIPATSRAGLIDAVRKAATTETVPAVLARMYRFLTGMGDTMSQPQDLLPITQGVLAILDARLGRVEQRKDLPMSSDANAVTWLADKVKTLNNAQLQAAVVRTAARLLADAAYVYTQQSPSEAQKDDLERTILLAEEQLTALFKAKLPSGEPPSPSVSSALTQTGAKQKESIAAAMAKWIGAGQTPGLLNPPAAFGLPIGLGIQRAAPATSSAPAS